MCGAEPLKVRANYAKLDIANPPLSFTINEQSFDRGGSLSHSDLLVESTEEFTAMGKLWRENGLISLDEMKTGCCDAFQGKIRVQDADGNRR